MNYVSVSTGFPPCHQVSATASATTTSGTDALLTSMTFTPASGTYLVMFNSDFDSNAAGAAISFSYYLAGTQIGASQQKISPFDGGALSAGDARGIAHLQYVITVNGAQAVEVRWSTSAGTATAANRTLIFLQITAV